MCGIIGYLGPKEVVPILIDGLRRLEYRGYDSAGVAVVRNGQIERRRSAGKLVNLEQAIDTQPLEGIYGVGHTRWATHGRPTEENAHPHQDCTGKIVVVHNGIIENYLDLKQELQKLGHTFVTETDTEIIAHLIEQEMAVRPDKLEDAARQALLHMRGLFAFVAISTEDPDKIIAVRNGPPIVVGIGENEFFVASDTPAILSHTRDVVFLGDEEMAVITRARRGVHELRRHAGLEGDAAGDVGPGHGGEVGLPPFHAQGDLRAAARGRRDAAGPPQHRYRPRVPGRNCDLRKRTCAASTKSC